MDQFLPGFTAQVMMDREKPRSKAENKADNAENINHEGKDRAPCALRQPASS